VHSQDLSKIDFLKWGARATGTNFDWCSTPGIKQKATSATSLYPHGVHEQRKLGNKKGRAFALGLREWFIRNKINFEI
jgi:hypothetical protein